MSGKRYTDEFKIEAVRQATDRGDPVKEVADRLGVTAPGRSRRTTRRLIPPLRGSSQR